jgi:hypothetical protein
MCDEDLVRTFWTLEIKTKPFGMWDGFDIDLLDSENNGNKTRINLDLIH